MELEKENLLAHLNQALKNWRHFAEEDLNFFSSYSCIEKDCISGELNRKQLKYFFLHQIEKINSLNQQVGDIITERFVYSKSAISIAHEYFLSKDQVNRRKREGISLLADLIIEDEILYIQYKKNTFLSKLPSKQYHYFQGNHKIIDLIFHDLIHTPLQNIFIIAGIGGIGKTALADFVTRRCILNTSKFENYCWIRLPNEGTEGLLSIEEILFQKIMNTFEIKNLNQHIDWQIIKSKFQEKTILIIIDNISSQEVFEKTMTVISKIGNDTLRFLLTSRIRPTKNNNGKIYWLNQLTFNEFNGLLAQSLLSFSQETDELSVVEKKELYALIGGNPLAIELVACLIQVFSYEIIKNEFIDCNIENIEGLYRKIFIKSWDILSSEAKNCLLVMPLIIDFGVTFDHLQAITELSRAQVAAGINQLYKSSLMELRGTMQEKRYGIHQLTNTFLKSEIINEKLIPLEK